MLLHELLSEGDQESAEIIEVSRTMVDAFIKSGLNGITWNNAFPLAPDKGRVPAITSPSLLRVLRGGGVHAKPLRFFFGPTLKWPGITGNTTGLYVGPPNQFIWVNSSEGRAKMVRILVHELQHAVDNEKSRGKYIDIKKTHSVSGINYKEPDYLRLPQEINARFTEALMLLAGHDLTGKSTAEKVASIKHALAINHIVPAATDPERGMDDRSYRRILSRAVRFVDAVQDIRIEPARRAKGLMPRIKELIGLFTR